MNLEIVIKLLSSFTLLLIGIMAKFSNNDGWSSVKKYWLLFIVFGAISLIFTLYKL